MSESPRPIPSTAAMALGAMRCRAGAPRLSSDELENHLKALPDWSDNASAIRKSFKFADFHATMAFVNAVAWIAHREDHHPDLAVSFNQCDIAWSTHDAGGITINDVICAAKIERLFA